MQTLWARVAQSSCSSCSLSSCSSSIATVTRRTATVPIRRRLGADDVFAAFFSTVAFASAVADTNRKDAKKEEWTRVIRDARRELTSMKAEQRRRISNIAHSPPFAPVASDGTKTVATEREWGEAFEWGDRDIQDRKALGLEDWQGIPMDVLRGASRDEIQHCLRRHPNHFPKFRGFQGSAVWSTTTWAYHIKKKKTLEWSIAHLALDLMSSIPQGQPESSPNDQETIQKVMTQLAIADATETDSRREHIQNKLRDLTRPSFKETQDGYFHRFPSPRWPNYSISQDDDSDSVHRLNAKLHSLFSHNPGQESHQSSYILPRICYYLLTSNAAPSIHTYNILISEFAGMGRDDLIHNLIGSMNRTHVRPNEITLAETLRHYIRMDDHFRFDRYVKRMDGFDQGLGEAHPYLEIPNLFRFQYRVRVCPLASSDQRPIEEYHELSDLDVSELQALREHNDVKVYEKSRRNLDVYHALIQGALFFHGPSEAIRQYRAMTSEGWEPSQEVLLSLLHHCRLNLEWEAGLVVWRRLQTLDEPLDERGFLLMLQLCQKCNRHEHIPDLLRHGTSQGALPSTVLEMEWQDIKTDPDKNYTTHSLNEAKSIEDLKDGLRVLIPKSRVKFSGLGGDLDSMRSMVNRIRRSLSQPDFGTINLLNQARIRIALLDKAQIQNAENHQYCKFHAMLRNSNSYVSHFLSELQDVRYSINVRELESQVLCQLSTFAQWLQETNDTIKNIVFSSSVRDLEDRVDTIGLYVEKSRTRVIRLNRRTISKQFHKLWLQAEDLRGQMKKIQRAISQSAAAYFAAANDSERRKLQLPVQGQRPQGPGGRHHGDVRERHQPYLPDQKATTSGDFENRVRGAHGWRQQPSGIGVINNDKIMKDKTDQDSELVSIVTLALASHFRWLERDIHADAEIGILCQNGFFDKSGTLQLCAWVGVFAVL
ncbi:MAG: hypothetical protein Q9168_005870 [Polycauliona sp. 1 TL-2023]